MRRPIMNTELILEEPQQVADSGGGVETIWMPVGTVWAEVKASAARERVIGGREVSELSHQITVRGAPEGSPRRPSPQGRFRSGDRVFQIRGVANYDTRGRFLTCWAKEAVYA